MKDYKRLTIRNDDGTWGVNYLELSNEVVKWQEQHATQYLSIDLTNILGEKLAEIEDKIENGTLVELPCKVGTTVYHLYKAGDVITEDKVFSYHFEICSKPCVSFENHFWYGTEKRVDTILVEHFGKYWFTDKAEAKSKLRELKGERE